MSDYIRTVNEAQWNLFVWMVDSCERKQGNCCKGCGFMDTCISLYHNISNICTNNKVSTLHEHINMQPSPGNPCVEGHGEDIEPALRRVRKGLVVTRKNGVPVR